MMRSARDMMDKILLKITGTILLVLSAVMFSFAIYFWCQEETAIIALTSFYISLAMSLVVCIIGITFIAGRKG